MVACFFALLVYNCTPHAPSRAHPPRVEWMVWQRQTSLQRSEKDQVTKDESRGAESPANNMGAQFLSNNALTLCGLNLAPIDSSLLNLTGDARPRFSSTSTIHALLEEQVRRL